MKKLIIAFTTIVTVGVIWGCSDDILDKQDITTINSNTFYNNEQDAISSVNANYAMLQNISLWARRIHFLFDFASDEIAPTPNTQGPPFELLLHTFGPTGNEHVNGVWDALYQTIAKTNITLDEVPAIEMDEELKARILGESRFIRALSYFYINAAYGGGPLRTAENLNEINVPRASQAEIWALIESDLQQAVNVLPWQYDEANVGRATRGAALSLLGKAQLFQEKYAEAEANFMEVINNGPYQLVGEDATTIEEAIAAMRSNHDFGVKNNPESVFEIQFQGQEGGFYWGGDARTRREATIRPREYGVDGKSFYNAKPSEALLSAFEGYSGAFGEGNTAIGSRDPRFEAFFFTENDTLIDGPYFDIGVNSGYAWKKYQDGETVQGNNPNDNDCNHDVIRYADVILMAAEAKIMQGKVGEGVELINRIRRRADPTGNILADIDPAISQDEAVEALIRERQVELCGEQVRRLDLIRWGIADQFIDGFQPGKHEFFPLPQGEIDNNTAIDVNNPGY